MIAPTIHLNGTSRDEISRQLEEAYAAVNAAIDALKRAAPNGRDYYPQGLDAIDRAMDEHFARMLKLQSVADEIENLANAF